MSTVTESLLTPEALAERWGLKGTEQVWEAVDDPTHPLPFLYFGRGTPRRGRRGQRGLYRFRLSVVEAWEAAHEQRFSADSDEPHRHERIVADALQLDKLRGGRKGKRGARGAA